MRGSVHNFVLMTKTILNILLLNILLMFISSFLEYFYIFDSIGNRFHKIPYSLQYFSINFLKMCLNDDTCCCQVGNGGMISMLTG